MRTFNMDRMRQAANKGAVNVQRAMGVDTDIDLRIYNGLSTDAFSEIAQNFGDEATVTYIEEMEKRRLGMRG
jgi:hypothetical protein